MRYFTLIFLTFIHHALLADKLIFALDLVRHGDRTPLYQIPALTHEWPEGKGQLTARGLAQEYQLGKKFRQKYVIKTRLLPRKYQKDTIYVRSTDFDRTLMSAQALLLGLYPLGSGPSLLPGKFQPVPVHTRAKLEDELIPQVSEYEQNKQALFEKYVYTQPQWQAKTALLRPKFDTWSQALKYPIDNLYAIVKAYDSLFIYQQHKIPLTIKLDKNDINEIIITGKWVLAEIFRPKAIGELVGRGLLNTIKQYIEDASSQKLPLKYVLFSGHDSSILALLSALGAPLTATPPLASVLNFSLYEAKDKSLYTVVSFNEQPLTIPLCQAKICTLPKVLAL